MSNCDQAFRDFLTTHQAGSTARLVVGFSGGLDSTVLLHLAQRHGGQRLRAIHVNHGYHPAAAAWQSHCEAFCAEIGVTLQSFCLPPSQGEFSENQARAARYQRFGQALADDEVLLLAHHRDDAAETLLLHLLQGRGSYSMPVSRRLGSAQLWRPLLALGREDLQRYAVRHELRWLEDPSNDDRRHDRNFLRHDILPRLNERFDSLSHRLLHASAQHQTMETLLTHLLELNQKALPLQVLASRPMSEQQTIVRLWLRSQDQAQPATRGLESFLAALANAGADRQPELRWKDLQLRRFDDRLWCFRVIAPAFERLAVSAPGEWLLPQGLLRISRCAGGIVPNGELSVHFWQAPDYHSESVIRSGGHRRSIKETLRAGGVPPWQRRGYPVVADNDGVLCIPGVALRDGVPRGEAGISVKWQPDD